MWSSIEISSHNKIIIYVHISIIMPPSGFVYGCIAYCIVCAWEKEGERDGEPTQSGKREELPGSKMSMHGCISFHFISFSYYLCAVQRARSAFTVLHCIVQSPLSLQSNKSYDIGHSCGSANKNRCSTVQNDIPTNRPKKKRHTEKYTKEERKLKSQAIQSQPSLALLPSPFQPPLTSFFFRF